MARALETIKDINDSKYLWKVAVLVKDLWVATNYKNIKHVEMVLADKMGHDIQVIVPVDLMDQFKEALAEYTTFTLQNFVVEKNNIPLKCSDHPFKLVFNSGTLIQDMNEHNIPHPGYKFQDFEEIKSGKVRPDLCVDVIGVFHELGYTQTVPGNRKMQINFKLKDTKGNILNCTLWEDFALQFQLYNKDRTEWGHTIIMIHNGKIKEATYKYELGVSNAWNATKFYINADIAPINEFKKSLGVEKGASSQSQSLASLSCGSQMYTQSASSSQYNAADKFFDKNATCTTVARTTRLLPNNKGWYYKACSKCPKATKGDTLPLIFPDGHQTHAINLRYKLEFEVDYEGTTAKIVLWDQQCNELLGKTAAELQLIMIEAGVTNPLEYPLCVDNICGRTFALRVKWQPTWGTCSVQSLKEDEAIINKIKDLFPKDEATSKMMLASPSTAVAPTQPESNQDTSNMIIPIPSTSATPVQPETNQEPVSNDISQDYIVIPTIDLSATSETDPFKPITITPTKGKRAAAEPEVSHGKNVDPSPPQLSSTRPKRNITIEKNPRIFHHSPMLSTLFACLYMALSIYFDVFC
ncbi:replication protein A 70 kDa DNA-binding subunit B [Trifolium repens]|nr:replication protein A 70 kDa DNA-binding subunit B [Trifolium repens]